MEGYEVIEMADAVGGFGQEQREAFINQIEGDLCDAWEVRDRVTGAIVGVLTCRKLAKAMKGSD